MQLMEMLPEEMTIVGLDEKTALILDPSSCQCLVGGLGMVTLLHTGHKHNHKRHLNKLIPYPNSVSGTDEDLIKIAKQHGGHFHQYHDKQTFPMSELGPFHPYHTEASLPDDVWQQVLNVKCDSAIERVQPAPREVVLLIQARQKARQAGNWEFADELRQQIVNLGWEISDTKDGPVSKKLS